jgi:hypothetical protein
MGHHPPRGPRADNPAEAIDDLPQAMLALGGVFGEEGQVRRHQGPFLSPDITGVGFSFQTASVTSEGFKCITPSSPRML